MYDRLLSDTTILAEEKLRNAQQHTRMETHRGVLPPSRNTHTHITSHSTHGGTLPKHPADTQQPVCVYLIFMRSYEFFIGIVFATAPAGRMDGDGEDVCVPVCVFVGLS